MRYAFVSELEKLIKNDRNIILLTADLGFTVFEDIAKKYPKQFLNIGVAESNMVGVATGLALSGKVVFIYSMTSFVTSRPFEQIRNDICLHNAPVVLVGVGAGLSYSHDGSTHHGTSDIAIMRALPNMTILSPSDPIETIWATKTAAGLRRPVYLRLGKRGEPLIHKNSIKLHFGKGAWINRGNRFVILSTGSITNNSLTAVKLLAEEGFSGSLLSIHTIKPIDTKLIERLSRKYSILVTIEEHSIIGGLGSAVAEVISQLPQTIGRLVMFGLPDQFHQLAGSQAYLLDSLGLSSQKIALKIKNILLSDLKIRSKI